MKSKVSIQYNKIPFVKKDYDSTRIYRNTHKKRVRHRLMTHPHTFLYLHFKSVILGKNKTVITEIVICNRFFSGIEKHTLIALKTMTISSQSYEL